MRCLYYSIRTLLIKCKVQNYLSHLVVLIGVMRVAGTEQQRYSIVRVLSTRDASFQTLHARLKVSLSLDLALYP